MQPTFGGLVFVFNELTGPTNLDAQLVQLIGDFFQFEGFNEISRRRFEGEFPKYILSAELAGEVSPSRSEFLVTVGGARTFELWIIASEDLFDQHQVEYMQVLDSFTITLPPPEGDIDPGGQVDEILDIIDEKVARIRGLPPPANLARRLITRERFAAEEAGSIDNEDRREIDRLKGLCVVMDLCEETDDLVQLLTDLLGQGVLGLYEPGDKSLTVVTEGDTLRPLEWLTYAHEYTHALQDVEFDLNPNPPKDTDRRREDSGRGWVRELQGRWPGVLG